MRSLDAHVRRSHAFPIDLAVVKDGVVIFADLPGVHKEDITVNVSTQSIIITALTPPLDLKVKHYMIQERPKPASRLKRRIDLPTEVDINKVKARFSGGNGVLKISFPLKKSEF